MFPQRPERSALASRFPRATSREVLHRGVPRPSPLPTASTLPLAWRSLIYGAKEISTGRQMIPHPSEPGFSACACCLPVGCPGCVPRRQVECQPQARGRQGGGGGSAARRWESPPRPREWPRRSLRQPGRGAASHPPPRPSTPRRHSFPALKYVFYYRLFNLMSNIPTALSTV